MSNQQPEPSSGKSPLDRFFKLSEHRTTVKTEVIAGITTFLTMAYIIFVNPSILSEAGMDYGAVFVATCVAAAVGCLVMGLWANYPIALAPGMGLNAFFTYGVVLGMGYSWETALGAVFLQRAALALYRRYQGRRRYARAHSRLSCRGQPCLGAERAGAGPGRGGSHVQPERRTEQSRRA